MGHLFWEKKMLEDLLVKAPIYVIEEEDETESG